MQENLPRYPVDAGRLTLRVSLPRPAAGKSEKRENPFGTAFCSSENGENIRTDLSDFTINRQK